MTLQLSRRGLLAGLAGATAASTLSLATRAGAQEAAGAAPAAPRVLSYARQVGDVEVTTLLDGSIGFDPAITGEPPEEQDRLIPSRTGRVGPSPPVE